MPIFKTKCVDCSIRVYRLFSLSGNMKQTFGSGYPAHALYHSIFILSIGNVNN